MLVHKALSILVDNDQKDGYAINRYMRYKARINGKRTLFRVVAWVLLPMALVVAQVSMLLANPPGLCVSGAGSSIPSSPSQAHQCCCGGTNACCCDVERGPTAALPDMALPAIAGGEYNPAPLSAVLDAGSQSLFPLHILTPAEGWTGTGPPLSLSYLVNLSFRC